MPRGGKGLIERISDESRVPVIKHLDGVCHTYIDDQADLTMAVEIAVNAKTQRYGTCNTMETLLVAQSQAATVLPRLAQAYAAAGVELRACERAATLQPSARGELEITDLSRMYLEAGELSVTFNAGYNLVVDSNVCSPSTLAPQT